MEYRYLAVVLKKRDIGEADRLYTVYSKESGKVTAFARGVRKSQARLAGHLENFCVVSIMVMRARGSGNIKSAVVERNAAFMKSSYDVMRCAFEAARIFDRYVEYESGDTGMFTLWTDFLEGLEMCVSREREASAEIVLRGFVIKLLGFLGYPLETRVCVRCRERLSERPFLFGFLEGGTICCACAPTSAVAYSVSKETIKAVRVLQDNSLINAHKLRLTPGVMRELRRVEADCLRWME